jgi:hypothetical protein
MSLSILQPYRWTGIAKLTGGFRSWLPNTGMNSGQTSWDITSKKTDVDGRMRVELDLKNTATVIGEGTGSFTSLFEDVSASEDICIQ